MATIEKGTLYLFSSKIVFFLTGYLLYFILGRFLLTPEEFGIFGVVVGLIGITNVLLAQGIQQSVSKFVSAQKELAPVIKRKAFKLEILLSIIFFFAYFLAAPFAAQIFNEPRMVLLIQISAIGIFFRPFVSIMRGYLNGLKRFKGEAVLAMATRILRLALPVLLVALGYSLFGAFLGIAIAMILSFSIGLAMTGLPTRNNNSFSSNTLILFALPVIAFSLIQSLLTQLDMFFVKAMLTAGENAGYYVAATTLAKLPYEAITTIALVLLPLVSETSFANRIAKTSFYIMHAFRYAILFILPTALIASVTALPLITLFYRQAYAPAASVLSILAIAYLFLAFFTISATIIIAHGKPKHVFAIGASALLLDFILNYYLVPILGMEGAAIATLASMAIAALITTAYVFGKFRVFPFRSGAKALLAAAIPIAISPFFYWSGLMLLLEYAILVAIYIVLLFLLREIREEDFIILRNALG